MSVRMVTDEDYEFFDFLSPICWPNKSKKQIAEYRELVADGYLQIETMVENALVAASNGKYTRIAEAYRDYTDGSDAKKAVSQFRNNNKTRNTWMNTFAISSLSKKKGLIRAVCYSREQSKFYFFAIPHFMYTGKARVDIILDQSTGYKEPNGIPQGKWAICLVESFERLATITPLQAANRCRYYSKLG
jgi:hypothetical protein